MAWKKLRQRESYEEIWVSVGKEKEGYFTLKEGGELVGYFEKLNHSEKFDSPILNLVSEDKKTRYLLFASANLARQMEELEDKVGSGVLVRIIYKGKERRERDGEEITYHSFEVEYDDERWLEGNSNKQG